MFFKKITEVVERVKNMVYVTYFGGNFRTVRIIHPSGGPKDKMLAQALKHPTVMIQRGKFYFQVSDILHTGSEIEHDIILFIFKQYHTQ